MVDPASSDMATRLLAEGFQRTGPDAASLSDPIADTPMIVTLDQLRPYEHNPRVTRNPLYDDIKASIRERGLDAPPAITRRPGDAHYVVRNGGNTRLAVLRELWSETRDERFFRIACLFRPWSSRGEIIALTGHLAENELHGGLSFIERALAVEKARELYEQESNTSLTQTGLSRRLTTDGYPVNQPHISRMQDTVRYLLPAIPHLLYAGLGRPQIERLTALRRAAARLWDARAAVRHTSVDFPSLFQDVLASFDGEPDALSIQRVQDELVGQMAELLGADYDALQLEIHDTESRQRALISEPSPSPTLTLASNPGGDDPARVAPVPPVPVDPDSPVSPVSSALPVSQAADLPRATAPAAPSSPHPKAADDSDGQADDARLRTHIVSPAPTTERLESIQQMIADQLGNPRSDFVANVLHAMPVQVGGLYPISDVWYIDPGLDAPARLRVHIAQFAEEIAAEADRAHAIDATADGIGFICKVDEADASAPASALFARAVLMLLHVLSAGYQRGGPPPTPIDHLRLADALGPLLLGRLDDSPAMRLSDVALVKLFRLLRLARRLLELETGTPSNDAAAAGN
ncbi:ParB family protein [Paraburkholderia ginsengisoli]|uniref:ParB family protein n=1 Tax=Paraburkholderia ginsengisoli TaxID=311231 RepID=A0A7T4T9W6_9BURK|nr:ParB family protein [Paraburkholderia ginsengisoli]QQC65462.1 ParB family protein [Paraburkholderia ginsengisoli]